MNRRRSDISVDSAILRTIESSKDAKSLDELFDSFLSNILQVKHLRTAEILLHNNSNVLVSVASAVKRGARTISPEISVQSYVLNLPVRHSRRKVRFPKLFPEFHIPLLGNGKLFGYLYIQMKQINFPDKKHMIGFSVAGTMLSAKIEEIKTKNEKEEYKREMDKMLSHERLLLRRITSLSKELYAISAITTAINQSRDFTKSLRKSVNKISAVFKDSSIVVFTAKANGWRFESATLDDKAQIPETGFTLKFIDRLEKKYVPEIVASGKPLVQDISEELYLIDLPAAEKEKFKTVVGVPLWSKKTVLGIIFLLQRSLDYFDQDGLRLLSGMTNILGMGIENINLYHESEQKKNENAFLVRSIKKFNEKLVLRETLSAVVAQGARFIGPPCEVYIFSKASPCMIHCICEYADGKDRKKINTYKTIQPGMLQDYYDSMMTRNKSTLLKKINFSKTISNEVKDFFNEKGICSLITVPLKLKNKKFGILLLASKNTKHIFDKRDLRFAEAIGGHAAFAIQNALIHTASLENEDVLAERIRHKTKEIMRYRDRLVVQTEKDIVIRVDRNFRFIFVNRTMEQISGYSRKHLCRDDVSLVDVVADEDQEKVLGAFERVFRNQLPAVTDLEYRHLNFNGNDHLISLTVYPEKDLNGQTIAVEGVGRDITEKKMLQKELKKAKDLAMLGEFSGAVAHQIRNPLGNILLGTKLLRQAIGIDNPAHMSAGLPLQDSGNCATDRIALRKIFRDLTDGIHNLNQVVSELLDYTKTLSLNCVRQPIDIILEETLGMFQEIIAQNGVQVERFYDTDMPHISIDSVLISQVFQNIIHNAIQAMVDGGRLVVTTRINPQKPECAVVSISDTGIGIKPAAMEKIFHPLYTNKDSGTGLGLSLAYRIVEAHKGTITACRNPCTHFDLSPSVFDPSRGLSKGVTFHICLPIAACSNPESTP